LLLTKYSNIQYILDLPFLYGVKFIRKAIKEHREKKMWEMWLSLYPHMTEKTYISFEDYKGQFEPKKEQTGDEMLAKVKLLNAMFGGEVVEVYE